MLACLCVRSCAVQLIVRAGTAALLWWVSIAVTREVYTEFISFGSLYCGQVHFLCGLLKAHGEDYQLLWKSEITR